MDAISYSYADEAHSRLDQVDTDLTNKEDSSNKGIADGYAGLDATGKVPSAQLPDASASQTYTESTTAPVGPNNGDEWLNLNNGVLYKYQSDSVDAFWVDISSAGNITAGDIKNYSTKTANYTLMRNDFIYADTTSGTFNLTLPITPVSNTKVYILDVKGNFSINNITILRNGETIMGLAEDLIASTDNELITLIYTGSDWRLI